MSNKPEDTLRDGNLKASIWRNEGEKGPYYTTILARTYTGDDGVVKDAFSFSNSDLLRISELSRQAYARTNELRREHTHHEHTRTHDQGQNHAGERDLFRQGRSGNGAAQQRGNSSR